MWLASMLLWLVSEPAKVLFWGKLSLWWESVGRGVKGGVKRIVYVTNNEMETEMEVFEKGAIIFFNHGTFTASKEDSV